MLRRLSASINHINQQLYPRCVFCFSCCENQKGLDNRIWKSGLLRLPITYMCEWCLCLNIWITEIRVPIPVWPRLCLLLLATKTGRRSHDGLAPFLFRCVHVPELKYHGRREHDCSYFAAASYSKLKPGIKWSTSFLWAPKGRCTTDIIWRCSASASAEGSKREWYNLPWSTSPLPLMA